MDVISEGETVTAMYSMPAAAMEKLHGRCSFLNVFRTDLLLFNILVKINQSKYCSSYSFI